MTIQNNCPNCGRIIIVNDDEINGTFHCYLCECNIELNYEMIIDSNNIETEIVVFKEKV